MILDNPINDELLRGIDGVALTPREIEVLACLLCGQKVNKQMAFILSITEKTAQIHIGNILKKINCRSREQVIDWLKQSEKQQELIDLYNQKLLPEALFKNALEKIALAITQETKKDNCLILYSKKQQEQIDFLGRIKEHLSLLGIKKIFSMATEEYQSTQHILQYLKDVPHTCLCIMPWDQETSSNHKISLELSDVLKQKKQLFLEAIFLFLDAHQEESLAKREFINFSSYSNYYVGFFRLIKKLYPLIDIEPFIQKFQQLESSMVFEKKKKPFVDLSSLSLRPEKEKSFTHWSLGLIKQGKSQLFIGLFLCVTSIFSLYLTSRGQYSNPLKGNDELIKSSIIHSSLPLPVDNVLLLRPTLLQQIDTKLKPANTITTVSPFIPIVAIVGIGGAGKTTLARYYARTHKYSLIWEIHAETKEILINSFEDLALALSKTDTQKKEFNLIQSIQNPEQKEKELFNFVKSLLLFYPDWLLIYDNVENLAAIKKYLPDDPEVWGHGKVIITTRDYSVATTNYIKAENVFELGELSEQEACILFCKIFYNGEFQELSAHQKNQVKNILEKIPLFPLDISIAAYYIKNNNLTYKQYIERMLEYSEQLDIVQTKLLQETSQYVQTRYGIVTSSLNKILQNKSDYRDLFLLICLLDSRDIPKKLLEFYKDPVLVDSFLFDLEKYSLITNNRSIEQPSSISLHKSIQSLSQNFLLKNSKCKEEEKKEKLIDKYITVITKFYQSIGTNYLEGMAFIPHLEAFLANVKNISSQKNKEKQIQDILYLLGCLYSDYSRNLMLEKKYFEETYQLQQKTRHFSTQKVAVLLKKLGEICTDLQLADEAIFYATQSNKFYKQLPHSTVNIADNYKSIGLAYMQKNDFEKAISSILEGIQCITVLNSQSAKESLSNLYAHLGWIYSIKYITGTNVEKAKQYIHKALQVMDADHVLHTENPKKYATKLSCIIAQHKETLSDIYCRLGDYAGATHYGLKDAQYIIDHSLDTCPHHLLNAYIANGRGHIYLRQGNLEAAKEHLARSIQIAGRIIGEDSMAVLPPLVAYIETRIRLGELTEAYEDCLFTFKIKNRPNNNNAQLLSCHVYYLMAVIKFKQGDLQKSQEHLDDFLKSIKPFCKTFLSEVDYQKLEEQNTFVGTPQPQKTTDQEMVRYLQYCTEIYTAIYGISHPFVRDFCRKIID